METVPYPKVAAVIDSLVPRIHEVLRANLVGLYLFGSLVTGDFDPSRSDIDLAAIVAAPLTAAELARLEAMHADIAREHPAWDDRIEVGYLAAADVNPFDPAATIAIISPGEPFHIRVAEHSWLFNLHVVREQGITLHGPDPRAVIGPVNPAALAAGLRARMREWRAWTDEPIAPMRAGEQAYVVLTMCRALYTHTTGAWTSKRQAAEWAVEAEPAWAPLIVQAIAWREAEPAAPVDVAVSQARMLDFTREITGRIIAGK